MGEGKADISSVRNLLRLQLGSGAPLLRIRRKEPMERPEVNIKSQPAPGGASMW